MNKSINAKLRSEIIWAATRQGSFQRSKIYKKNSEIVDSKKKAFRKFVKEYLFNALFLKFEDKIITESQLMTIIEKLRSQAALHHNPILVGGELRFGNAQKFVNLYLKSMWLAGWLKIPPHFPVDSIIQKDLRVSNKRVKWTRMKKEEYVKLIKDAKIFAKEKGYRNVAEWEAITYLNNYIENVYDS